MFSKYWGEVYLKVRPQSHTSERTRLNTNLVYASQKLRSNPLEVSAAYVIALEMLHTKTFLIFFRGARNRIENPLQTRGERKNDVFSGYSNLKNSGVGIHFPDRVCEVIRR